MLLKIILYIISCIAIWKIMHADFITLVVRVAAVIMIVIAMRTFVLQ